MPEGAGVSGGALQSGSTFMAVGIFLANVTILHMHATSVMGWWPLVLQAWQRDTAAFSALSELHNWMHATHLCYAVARQVRSLQGCYMPVLCNAHGYFL